MKFKNLGILILIILFPIISEAKVKFSVPLKNWSIICKFKLPCVKSNHLGVDADGSVGTPVYAPSDGIVKEAEWHSGYGGTVIIEHGNGESTSVLGHLKTDTLLVQLNSVVKKGDLMGYLGAKVKDKYGRWENGGYTPHLHWGVRKGPYDPGSYKCGNKYEWNYAGYTKCSDKVFSQWYDPEELLNQSINQDNDTYTISDGDCNDNDPYIHPGVQELCNTKDDDCDGKTDEEWGNLGKECEIKVKKCLRQGVMICAPNGIGTVCDADYNTYPELCNGKDDDCDGQVDEEWQKGQAQDLGNPCTVGLGGCQNQGTMVCAKDGKATVCSVDAKPSQLEVCDGKDNDCDGKTDNYDALISCDTPPQTFCFDLVTLRTFFSPGVCIEGICSYSFLDTICLMGCQDNICQECLEDSQCPNDYKCDIVNTKCIPKSCNTDVDCPNGYQCQHFMEKSGHCVFYNGPYCNWNISCPQNYTCVMAKLLCYSWFSCQNSNECDSGASCENYWSEWNECVLKQQFKVFPRVEKLAKASRFPTLFC